jgi:hypothetical protein
LLPFILIIIFGDYLLLTIRHHLFPIVNHRIIIWCNILLETIKEPSLPNIDDLVRTPRNEVVTVSAKLRGI